MGGSTRLPTALAGPSCLPPCVPTALAGPSCLPRSAPTVLARPSCLPRSAPTVLLTPPRGSIVRLDAPLSRWPTALLPRQLTPLASWLCSRLTPLASWPAALPMLLASLLPLPQLMLLAS